MTLKTAFETISTRIIDSLPSTKPCGHEHCLAFKALHNAPMVSSLHSDAVYRTRAYPRQCRCKRRGKALTRLA